MSKCWVVVAESSYARIFDCAKPGGALREIEGLVHPESRLHAQSLHSDAPGRTFDSFGQGRHALVPDTDPKRHEAKVFARDIARHLESARVGKKLEALVLVAPPAFLGLLREHISEPCRQRVVQTISKNLVHENKKAIADHLAPKTG
jgi:protein required for attachment to host cells